MPYLQSFWNLWACLHVRDKWKLHDEPGNLQHLRPRRPLRFHVSRTSTKAIPWCEFSRATDSKDCIKIFATAGESGNAMAAPDICLKNLPWKTKYAELRHIK
ncbi:hypothetical protein Trydic_g12405 [Trypoxylus dichotomus]